MSEFVNIIDTNQYTIKHILMGENNENNNYVKNKFRLFRDIATDAFTGTILQNNDKRYTFLDYTYHKINSDIQLNINKKLIELNMPPLFNSEVVHFIYKGGNVMKEYGDNIFSNLMKKNKYKLDTSLDYIIHNIPKSNDIIIENFRTNITFTNNETIKNHIDSILSKLTVSDVDYSVIIAAETSTRFLAMHKIILDILAKSLYEISLFFDDLLIENNTEFTDDIKNEIYKEHKPNSNNLISSKYKLLKIKSMMSSAIYTDKTNLDNEIHHLINKYDDEKFSFENNILTLLNIYHIFETIIYILREKDKVQHNDKYNKYINFFVSKSTIIKNKVDMMIKYKKYIVTTTTFYNENDINEIKKKIVESMNKVDHNKQYYETYFDGRNYLIYSYKRSGVKANVDNIKIEGRNSSIITSVNCSHDIYKQGGYGNKLKHYITYNNIINVIQREFIINFDLIRSKLNILIDDFFHVQEGRCNLYEYATENCTFTSSQMSTKIPSEFLDISIPQYNTINRNYKRVIDHYTVANFGNHTHNVSLYTYTLLELYDDLIFIIFVQNNYCPWNDQKYSKRLVRAIFFQASHSYLNDKNLDPILLIGLLAQNVLQTIKHNNDEQFNKIDNLLKLFFTGDNWDIFMENFELEELNQTVFLMTMIKKKYRMMYIMILDIVLFYNLSKKNNIEYIRVINLVRNYYGFIPIDQNIDSFVNSYRGYFEDMLKTIVSIAFTMYYLFNDEVYDDISVGGDNIYTNKYMKYARKYNNLIGGKESKTIIYDIPYETSMYTPVTKNIPYVSNIESLTTKNIPYASNIESPITKNIKLSRLTEKNGSFVNFMTLYHDKNIVQKQKKSLLPSMNDIINMA